MSPEPSADAQKPKGFSALFGLSSKLVVEHAKEKIRSIKYKAKLI